MSYLNLEYRFFGCYPFSCKDFHVQQPCLTNKHAELTSITLRLKLKKLLVYNSITHLKIINLGKIASYKPIYAFVKTDAT